MNLENFQKHIKTLSKDELHTIGAELEQKLSRVKNPQYRLGYQIAIDSVLIQIGMIMNPINNECENITDDELLELLT